MDLQQRVERLECENRRLKLVGGCLLVLVVSAIAWQLSINHPKPATAEAFKVTKFDVIEARTLKIVGDDGNTLAGLTGGLFFIANKNNKGAVSITITKDGDGVISLFNKEGERAKSILP